MFLFVILWRPSLSGNKNKCKSYYNHLNTEIMMQFIILTLYNFVLDIWHNTDRK